MFPARRLIACTSKALWVYEGLYEHGLVSVSLQPVIPKATHASRQDSRCKVGDLHPGRDQEARVRYHVTQIFPARSLTPANPIIACRDAPCDCTEGQCSHPAHWGAVPTPDLDDSHSDAGRPPRPLLSSFCRDPSGTIEKCPQLSSLGRQTTLPTKARRSKCLNQIVTRVRFERTTPSFGGCSKNLIRI
jgi:hypothetical protein